MLKRVWTRQEAIENLEDYSALHRVGGKKKAAAASLQQLQEVLEAEGYLNFELIEFANQEVVC